MEPNYKTLTAAESQIVLATTESGRPKKSVESWLQMPDMQAIVNALKDRVDEVYLPTYGKLFVLTVYTNGRFHIKPQTGFVPCGWFSVAA